MLFVRKFPMRLFSIDRVATRYVTIYRRPIDRSGITKYSIVTILYPIGSSFRHLNTSWLFWVWINRVAECCVSRVKLEGILTLRIFEPRVFGIGRPRTRSYTITWTISGTSLLFDEEAKKNISEKNLIVLPHRRWFGNLLECNSWKWVEADEERKSLDFQVSCTKFKSSFKEKKKKKKKEKIRKNMS